MGDSSGIRWVTLWGVVALGPTSARAICGSRAPGVLGGWRLVKTPFWVWLKKRGIPQKGRLWCTLGFWDLQSWENSMHRKKIHIFRAESTTFWPCLGKPAWLKWSSQEFPLDLLSNPRGRPLCAQERLLKRPPLAFHPSVEQVRRACFFYWKGRVGIILQTADWPCGVWKWEI